MCKYLKIFLLMSVLAFSFITLIPIPILFFSTDHSMSEILLLTVVNYRYLVLSFTFLSALVVSLSEGKIIFWDRYAIGAGIVSAAAIFIIVRTIMNTS